MNLFNFDQKDMINSEDKIEYTLYAQNLILSMKNYFQSMGISMRAFKDNLKGSRRSKSVVRHSPNMLSKEPTTSDNQTVRGSPTRIKSINPLLAIEESGVRRIRCILVSLHAHLAEL